MKQHITVKQLNELSKKGKERLRKWWMPEWTDLLLSTEKKPTHNGKPYQYISNFQGNKKGLEMFRKEWKHLCLPLLSIGQMIEFLGDDWYWEVFTANDIGDVLPTYENLKELCDHLWKATKEKLEKGYYQFKFFYTDRKGERRWEIQSVNEPVWWEDALEIVKKHISTYNDAVLKYLVPTDLLAKYSQEKVKEIIKILWDCHLDETSKEKRAHNGALDMAIYKIEAKLKEEK